MDLNGDGIDDVITGEYSPGNVLFFEGTDSGLKASVILEEKHPEGDEKEDKPSGNSFRRMMSTAHFVDWDQDGDFDMVVGNVRGEVFLNRNNGTAKEFQFGQRVALETKSGPIKVKQKSDPLPVDWDGDGHLDLLVGDECSAVTFFRGVGDGTFEEGVSALTGNRISIEGSFKEVSERFREDSKIPGYRLRLGVTDWNNDGKLDLLVGNCYSSEDGKTLGNVYLYLRK